MKLWTCGSISEQQKKMLYCQYICRLWALKKTLYIFSWCKSRNSWRWNKFEQLSATSGTTCASEIIKWNQEIWSSGNLFVGMKTHQIQAHFEATRILFLLWCKLSEEVGEKESRLFVIWFFCLLLQENALPTHQVRLPNLPVYFH